MSIIQANLTSVVGFVVFNSIAIEDKLYQMNDDLGLNFTFHTLTSKQFVFGSNSKVIMKDAVART